MGTERLHQLWVGLPGSRYDAARSRPEKPAQDGAGLRFRWCASTSCAAGVLAAATLVVDVRATLVFLSFMCVAVLVSVTRSIKNLRGAIANAQQNTVTVARDAQKLAAEHARLLAVLASQKEAVIAADGQGRVVLMNPSAEGLTGWTASSARGRRVAEIAELEPLCRNDANAAADGLAEICHRVAQTGGPFGDVGSYALMSRQGRRSVIATSVAAIEALPPNGTAPAADVARHGVVVTMRELSSYLERLAHEQQQERLDIVDGMIGALERVGRRIPGPLDEHVAAQPEAWGRHKASARGDSDEPERDMEVRRPLLYVGARRGPVGVCDLTELLTDTAQFLPRLLGTRYEVVLQPAEPSMRLAADFVGLREALLRFALAGRPNERLTGGVLTLRGRRVSSRDAGLPRSALGKSVSGSYVRIDVQDSGNTRSRQQLLRQFEPFRFDKEADVVSSLAAAKGYRLVREMQGALLVESSRYHGSTLAVCVPAWDAETCCAGS